MSAEENDADLHALLTSARLREPSRELDARIERALRKRWSPLVSFALAAGLLLCAGIGLWTRFHHPQVVAIHPPALEVAQSPLQMERVFSQVYDDGIVAVADNVPYQQYRRRTVRQVWMIDPATKSQIQLTIPTDQILIARAPVN